MTDPNVVEAMRVIAAAMKQSTPLSDYANPALRKSAPAHMIEAADKALAMLAAAEKPAEAAPVVTGGIQYDPEGHALVADGRRAHVDPDGWFGFANKERAGVYVESRGLESSRRAVRAMRDAGLAAVRGEAAPVAPALPWVVRRKSDGQVFAAFLWEGAACEYAEDFEYVEVEVAAAPTVAAVKFTDDGDACGDGWGADVYYERDGRPSSVVVSIDIRPGEDAGETLAKVLAAVGRGP